jgi:hypothetical protein
VTVCRRPRRRGAQQLARRTGRSDDRAVRPAGRTPAVVTVQPGRRTSVVITTYRLDP